MVPIQNLYYLLCYAWDFPEMARRDVGRIEGDRVQDLLAHLLAHGVDDQLRRGLYRSYVAEEDDLRAPRGKLLLSPTASRALELRSRVACSFDELSYDVGANRILKATLRMLTCSQLDRRVARVVQHALRRMPAISEVPLDAGLLHRVEVPRTAGGYRFLFELCALAFEWSAPMDGGIGRHFIDVGRDPAVRGQLKSGQTWTSRIRPYAEHETGPVLLYASASEGCNPAFVR